MKAKGRKSSHICWKKNIFLVKPASNERKDIVSNVPRKQRHAVNIKINANSGMVDKPKNRYNQRGKSILTSA